MEVHSIELKVVQGKKVVFLDMDEFNKLYSLELPSDKKHLERVRDVFCFQCLTSLRYSDVLQLEKNDIQSNYINVVTEKIDEILQIPLSNKALPVISNQKMNDYIKEICYLAEINQPH